MSVRLSEILEQARSDASEQRFVVGEDWSQGRATFGGVVGAVAMQAMLPLVASERRPRSLALAFVNVTRAGEVEVTAQTLRSGRGVSYLEARVVQDGELRCVGLACFAAGGASDVQIPGPARPPAPDPEGLERMPFVAGMTPAFTRHFDYRVVAGEQGLDGRTIGGWFRLDEPGPHRGAAAIVALADAWPPGVFPVLRPPVRAFSVTWTIEFIDTEAGQGDPPADSASAGGWWFYRGETDTAMHGLVHERATLWDPAGRVAAVCRRVITLV